MNQSVPSFVFNPDSLAHVVDPRPDYTWLRDNAPVYDWRERDSIVISRAEHLRTLFTDERLSLDQRDWGHYPGDALFTQPRYAAWARVRAADLFALSTPDHTRVRKLASAGLTPRAIKRMDATIETTVASILERVSTGKEVLNVAEYAEAIPMTVISDILGIPEAQRAAFRSYGLAVIDGVKPTRDIELLNRYADAFTEGVAMLEQIIEARRAMRDRPDDMLTDWIEAQEDNQRLTNDELIALTSTMIVAGSDTTVHGTNFAVYNLLRRPEVLAELRAKPELVRGAVEESLRYDFFGKTGVMRFALEDFEWEGVSIRKGQLLFGMIGAAGHDPTAHDEPGRFDIHRPYRTNLSFGLGRHFCLGASLARSELVHAVTKLLIEVYPESELAGEPSFDPSNMLMRAIVELPVRLGPKAG